MADRQDIDALMVGALYGEIDAAERSRLDAHLSSHPEDKAALDALERTRAEVRRGLAGMQAAEPPLSISQTLLAAARETGARGAVEAPSQGLWSRFVEWMRPVAGHPAFAAAAVLVLVAGTATALWMRDAGKATEPELRARESHASVDQKADSLERSGGEAAPAVTDTAPPPPPGVGAGSDEGNLADNGYAAPQLLPETRNDQQAATAGHKPGKGAAPRDPREKAGRRDNTLLEVQTESDDVTIKEEESIGRGEGAAAGLDGDDKVAEDRRVTTTTATSGAGKQPAPEPAAIDPAVEQWAKNAHKRLAKLVADGKCPEAGRLGAEIKDRAPEYYASNVANDRAIRACKSYIEGQAKKKADKNYKSRSQANSVDDEAADISAE